MTQQAFGIGDLGPVQLALRGVRTHLGFGGIQLLARHGFLARQAPVALQIGLGVVQQRLGARQFSLGGGQRGQVGRVARERGRVALGAQRHLLGGRQVHFAAQGAHGFDLGLELGHVGLGGGIHRGRVGLRVRLHADAVGDAFLALAGHHRHLLPEFFPDERNDRA
ncbi:hypothetical protein G6F62_014465 [Rhizopus arrhizus]|nr:hypothetical protein G6F62_014465 [Rhizopus arrhizus]